MPLQQPAHEHRDKAREGGREGQEGASRYSIHSLHAVCIMSVSFKSGDTLTSRGVYYVRVLQVT